MKNKRTKSGAREARGGGGGDSDKSVADTSYLDNDEDDIDVGSPETSSTADQPIRIKVEDGPRQTHSPDQTSITPSLGSPDLSGVPDMNRMPIYSSEMFNRLAYPFQSKLFNSCLTNVKSNF